MIEWEGKYSVGVSIIDEEHKKLVDIINKVIVAKQHRDNSEEISEILNEMMKYAHEHFKNEEAYMVKFNYPMYQYHREEHLGFSLRTLSYQSRVINGDYNVASEILEYLKKWLVTHIQKTDKEYSDCFRKNGLK
ncbi:MAG: bacteriohemerythrin [Candidatus Scalindua sp.]|jgi:hemerythrin|nr:bacteriohemerythrin [Candidatus Scalindua sp.]MDV5165226.1 bacteriohemerythrin [Candidatus Scalindua sp.]